MRQVTKRNIIILVCVTCLYCLNRFWLKKVISLPVIGYILRCHFNDFLAGIAILAYINLMLSLSKYHRMIITTFPKGIVISLTCGLLWEYVFPLVFPHGTSDYLDVISYVLGGIVYIILYRVYINRVQSRKT